MSTIKELEEAQQGYLAAKLAVEKTKPAVIARKITYEIEDTTSITEKRIVDAGKVSYNPENGYITISVKADSGYEHEISFKPIVAPLFIKALRELSE
jgi:hypothetical protein